MRSRQVALKVLGLLGLASGMHLSCRNLGGAVDTSDASGAEAGAGANVGTAAGARGGTEADASANTTGATGTARPGGGAGTGGSTENGASSGAAPANDAAAGSNNEGSTGGTPASSGGAGAGGTAGNPIDGNAVGAAGINEGDVDNLVPGCVSFVTTQPQVTFTTPHGLAATTTSDNTPYVLFATQPADNTVALRWKVDRTANASWTPWGCFDFVPYPARITAINVGRNPQNSSPEIYASTSLGKLYVRRELIGWAPWQMLSLPQSGSHIIDVAATRTIDTAPVVYVIDNGKLFARHHIADDSLSGYSPWKEIPDAPPGASRVCAGVRSSDHRQQVFVLTTSGAVFDATQQTSDLDGLFSGFESSGTNAPALSDIACGYTATGDIAVFALNQGNLWSRDNATSVWLEDAVPAPIGESLRQFAVGSTTGVTPTIFGTGVNGALYSHAAGGSWVKIP